MDPLQSGRWAMLLLMLSASAVGVASPQRPSESSSNPAAPARRPLTAGDLVRLRDIGPVSPEPDVPAFLLSPDKRKLAFQIREADPDSNSYRLEMYVMDVRVGAVPVRVDSGGDVILKTVIGAGGISLETGLAAAIRIRWVGNGNGLYFLKRTSGRTGIWYAAADGSESKPVVTDAGNIIDFVLSSDGKRLAYAATPPDAENAAALTKEARHGYRYDARWIPIFVNRPRSYLSSRRNVMAIDIVSGKPVSPSQSDMAALEAGNDASPAALSREGRLAFARRAGGAAIGAGTQLEADDLAHVPRRCGARACSDPTMIWWTKDGARVRFLRRDGWGSSQTAIYEWTPGTRAPTRLFGTDDLLSDCQSVEERLLCAREQSTTPRQIVLFDAPAGTFEILFDANPLFRTVSLGKVERLHWRNRFGIESFGDLIYPVGYEPGRAYPTIVVQYVSRGFLRGGTGDEVPIQAFANRSYAVLSIQRPSTDSFTHGARSGVERERLALRDFRDRKSVQSSVETALHMLIRRGIVDGGRIGITGLSDGSSTVQFAAVNSRMFKAASVSGCCWEPFQDALLGPVGAKAYHQSGWPPLMDEAQDFWSHISLVRNARRVALPILMQQSDDEYLGALASYTALKQAGKPVALFVFPDEHHVKWQPAHRLAVYDRNLAWFDYWLRGIGEVKDILDEGAMQHEVSG